jgi:hypothetical protein
MRIGASRDIPHELPTSAKARGDEYRCPTLGSSMDAEIDIETFYAKAPRFQPNASLIKGVVCGVRVEEIEDETMRKARYLDKLIDELAKGKAMEGILRK